MMQLAAGKVPAGGLKWSCAFDRKKTGYKTATAAETG
jgi:hypothetical protein